MPRQSRPRARLARACAQLRGKDRGSGVRLASACSRRPAHHGRPAVRTAARSATSTIRTGPAVIRCPRVRDAARAVSPSRRLPELRDDRDRVRRRSGVPCRRRPRHCPAAARGSRAAEGRRVHDVPPGPDRSRSRAGRGAEPRGLDVHSVTGLAASERTSTGIGGTSTLPISAGEDLRSRTQGAGARGSEAEREVGSRSAWPERARGSRRITQVSLFVATRRLSGP